MVQDTYHLKSCSLWVESLNDTADMSNQGISNGKDQINQNTVLSAEIIFSPSQSCDRILHCKTPAEKLWPGLLVGWNSAKLQLMFLLPALHNPGLVASYLFLCKDCLWTVYASFQLTHEKIIPNWNLAPSNESVQDGKTSVPVDKFYFQLFLQMLYSRLQTCRIQILLLIWNLALPSWTGVTVRVRRPEHIYCSFSRRKLYLSSES